MGWHSNAYNLQADDCVEIRTHHILTEAKLVLFRTSRAKWPEGTGLGYVVGWQGWDGYRAVISQQVRWYEVFRTEAQAEARFDLMYANGPPRKPTPKKRSFQFSRFWNWFNACVHPTATTAELDDVEKAIALIYRKLAPSYVRPPQVKLRKKGRTSFVVDSYTLYFREKDTLEALIVEVAHAVRCKTHPDPQHHHGWWGPEFVNIVKECLALCTNRKRSMTRSELIKYKVKF